MSEPLTVEQHRQRAEAWGAQRWAVVTRSDDTVYVRCDSVGTEAGGTLMLYRHIDPEDPKTRPWLDLDPTVIFAAGHWVAAWRADAHGNAYSIEPPAGD